MLHLFHHLLTTSYMHSHIQYFSKIYLHVCYSFSDAMQTVLLREHQALYNMIFLSFYIQYLLFLGGGRAVWPS
jgi:hypothetical protein